MKPNFVSGGDAPLSIYLKICISHYQILTQFPVLFDIVFPSIFQDWLDALAVLSLDIMTFAGIACIADVNLYSEFTITMAAPVIGLSIIFVCYRVRLWRLRSIINDDEAEPRSASNGQYASSACRSRDLAVWCAIGWLFLVYTILCRTTFRSFACQDIDEGESFHRTDYTIDCNSDAYRAYAVIAAIFIFIYPVGVPLCFGFLLYKNRQVLRGNASGGGDAGKWWFGDSETLNFLVDGYNAQTFWFEIVDFIRKLLMAGGVIFLDRGRCASEPPSNSHIL